ncbi:MAG TPA: FkbM family methyltransferase, partial [Parachlamydiaceae bacterium]|nr:FkbM family methyltransferase [Parachlamydiaceae bacterium]
PPRKAKEDIRTPNAPRPQHLIYRIFVNLMTLGFSLRMAKRKSGITQGNQVSKRSDIIFHNGNILIKHCKHGYFAYNQYDDFVSRSLEVYGEWCDQELDFFNEMLNEGDVVLDVGAYIGTHAVFFAKKVGALGKVHAFEPQRSSFQMLCTNLTLNALYNTHCYQVGVSDKSTTIKLPVVDPYEGMNYGAIAIDDYLQGEDLQLITIDSLNLKQCNLIKVDVEGMEAKVLKGARQTIKELRPVLYVENNNTDKSSEILQILLDLKYDCWWHFVPYFNPENFFKSKENIFITYKRSFEANLVCFPKEQNEKPDLLIRITDIKDNWIKAGARLNLK